MKKGAHGKKPGALRAPGSTQLPHNVLYYKHYLQLFNTEKVFSPWQPIWKRCEDRNDSNLSQKKGPISFIQTVTMHLTYFSFSDNVHFYVFWCLLARSKTQYQSFCDWVVWGQNRTKRCKYYHMISNSVRPIPNIRSLSADIIRPTPNTIKMAIFHVFHVILRKKWRFLVVFTNFFKNANKNGS